MAQIDTSIPALLDDGAYVLTAAAAYEGFAAAHPQIAFYVGMAAALLYALANRLAPAPAA